MLTSSLVHQRQLFVGKNSDKQTQTYTMDLYYINVYVIIYVVCIILYVLFPPPISSFVQSLILFDPCSHAPHREELNESLDAALQKRRELIQQLGHLEFGGKWDFVFLVEKNKYEKKNKFPFRYFCFVSIKLYFCVFSNKIIIFGEGGREGGILMGMGEGTNDKQKLY